MTSHSALNLKNLSLDAYEILPRHPLIRIHPINSYMYSNHIIVAV